MIIRNDRTYNAHRPDRGQQIHGTRLASFTARAAAFITDFVLVIVLFLLFGILGSKAVSSSGLAVGKVELQFNLSNWYTLVVFVAYYALATYWGNGRTLGKWLFRIRVVSLVHERITFWHSLERALGYGASFLEFGFGFLQYFIDPNHRTVHDRIAETIVVSDGRSKTKANSRAAAFPDKLPPNVEHPANPDQERVLAGQPANPPRKQRTRKSQKSGR